VVSECTAQLGSMRRRIAPSALFALGSV